MTTLDHVGIAVRSLAERLAIYEALGLTVEGEELVESEGVRVAFLPVDGTRVELLEPVDGSSAIASFLARHGEGIHHLCFAVDDLDAAMEALAGHGVERVSRKARRGAGGARVCFLHPRTTGGVLIELSERGR